MTDPTNDPLSALRRAFDDSFLLPARRPPSPDLRLLSIRAGELALALPIEQIAAVLRCPPLTQLPPDGGERHALAAVKGVLVVVRPIESLLEGAPVPSPAARRWLVTLRSDPSAGLSFDDIEGYLELEEQALSRSSGDVIHVQGGPTGPRTIVDLTRKAPSSEVLRPSETMT